MQLSNLTRWLQRVSDSPLQWAARKILAPLYDRQSSVYIAPASGAGIVIQGAANPGAKIGATALLVMANGIFQTVAANSNLPALVGTVLQNNFGCWAFFCDQFGNLSTIFGVQGATLQAMQLPQFPVGQVLIGFLYCHPTTANFVGGTTNLDAANTNVVFVSPSEAFDPYCTIFQPGFLGGTE